jgi:hypothetical protein
VTAITAGRTEEVQAWQNRNLGRAGGDASMVSALKKAAIGRHAVVDEALKIHIAIP